MRSIPVRRRSIKQPPAPGNNVSGGGGVSSTPKTVKGNPLPQRTVRSSHAIGTVSRKTVKRAVRRFG